MAATTLVEEQIDAGAAFQHMLLLNQFDVTVAFWVKVSEDENWLLYIVSKVVDDQGLGAAYRAAHRVFRQMSPTWLLLSDVKLIGVKNPIACDVLEIMERYPGVTPTRSRRPNLGDMTIEEVYIYPRPRRETPTPDPGVVELRKLKRDVKQTIGIKELLEPLTAAEQTELNQHIASGLTKEDAEYRVRSAREVRRPKKPITAGTVVRARVVSWWGDQPADDPNPLLRVETEDGREGLVSRNETEPV